MKTRLLLIALLFGLNTQAQDGYQFTLTQNSIYNYSVKAVPNFTSVTGSDPDLESFGFAIMLQEGASIDFNSLVLPYGIIEVNNIEINTVEILDPFDPGYDRSSSKIAIRSGAFLGFPGHAAGDEITIATFDILGTPTTGEIRILDNESALAKLASSTLDSFINTDTTGGFSAKATYKGQIGTVAYSFETTTLNTSNVELVGVSIFPNPTVGEITIKGAKDLQSVTIYNTNGQGVLHKTSNLNTIDLSNFPSGLYFVKLYANSGIKTIKVIKE